MLEGKDDKQRKVIIDALVQIEVQFSKSKTQQWPSLFSNLIEPRKKNLSSTRQLYESLTDEQIELRLAIHSWEGTAWSIYESLMGSSLLPLSYSIEPKRWAKKELLNVELLLEEGKNQLMTSRGDFCLGEIPKVYNQLLIGKWDNFISLDELKRFSEAESKYARDHDFDLSNIESIRKADFNICMARPREEHFLNKTYIAAQEIQALVWYKEFLKEIMRFGITFYADDQDDNQQDNRPKRKYVDVKNLKRSNDGYER